MKLVVVTIVLDGMPFIQNHLDIFNASGLDWRWLVIEGQAAPSRDTSWCKPMPFRLSTDGTHEYMCAVRQDPRVTFLFNERWENKTSMVNEAVRRLRDPCVLMQIDSDEIWKPEQLRTIVSVFRERPIISGMHFKCKFFLGPDIVVKEDDEHPGNPGNWTRAWRFRRGLAFSSHEPPVLSGNRGRFLPKEETAKMGLVFDHYSYATEAQVAYKEKFYGYAGAVDGWRRLQKNKVWPAKLKDFLPWSQDVDLADKIR